MSTNQTLKTYSDLQVVDLPAVEIFAEGSWNGDKYDSNDLQAMIDAFDKVGFEPTVKAGHADGQDSLNEKEYRKIFGAPALGYVSRIYRKGTKLLADLKQVPRQFANLIKAGTYKRVSSEIYWSYKDEAGGKTYPRVLKSIAFLGAEIPALPSLKAIEALFHKNANGLTFAYDNGHEYRLYEMDKQYAMTMAEKDGKFCVYSGDKMVGEYDSKEEAMAAIKAGGDPMTDGEIKDDKQKYSKGDIQMTEAEVQAKLDAMKADLTKSYEAQAQTKADEAVAKVKAEADAEKAKLVERVALLEKQNEESAQYARNASIDARLEKLKTDGKISPVEQTKMRAIFRSLPEAAVHTYAGEDGKDVKESVIETIWKLYESRNSNIFKELAQSGTEVRSYSDAQDEVIRRANELMTKDANLTMQKAYVQVAKSDPELWHKYNKDVKGSH